jgi:molybdate transport system substrate-binding protein
VQSSRRKTTRLQGELIEGNMAMSTTHGLLMLLALGLAAQPARAADLVVLSAAAMKTAVSSLPADFTAATGDKVSFIFGTAGFIRDKAVSGEAFDLVIVPPAPLGDLVKRGLVIDGSMQKLGLVQLGAAVQSGTPHPAIDTEAAFKATLLAAKSIGMADPASGATSGIYLAKLLEQLGVMEAVRPKLQYYPEGQVAMEAAARGEVAFGLGQISEILPVKGTDLLGPIPDALQLKTIYAAGLAQHSKSPEAAQRLMRFLQGPQAIAAFKAQGFETNLSP